MADNNGWNGFVNINLGPEHRKAIKALAKSMKDKDIVGKLLEYVSDGYRVSFSPDDRNDAVVVTMTGKEGSANAGYSFSQRHSDPMVALAAVVFCHEELCDRGSWQVKGETQLGFNW